ncbi:MAG: 50S ribosomal protein L5, partial [Alphaproteobacteria bacterium]
MSASKKLYETQIKQSLQKELGYTNVMQVPKLDKIVINMCVPEATQDSKKVQAAYDDLIAIAGQKPVITKAKKSIASFKV